jgi:hypothetical protein
MPNQRQQRDSRTLWYPEGASTPGSDTGITQGYVVPLAGENGVADTQEPQRMPIGMADGLSDSLVAGIIRAGGALPIGLEYDFFGFPLAAMYTGYAHVGSTLLHEFYEDVATAGARPQSFQLQDELLESPAQYTRGRYNRLSELSCSGAESGGAQVGLQVLGVGDIVDTDLGGTKTNYGFAASNYFDGYVKYKVDGTEHTLSLTAALNAFSSRLYREASVPPAFFNSGVGAHVSLGVLNCETQLGIPSNVGGSGPTANLGMYSDAKNRKVISIDFLLANGPLATATAYWRRQISAALVFRQRPRPAPGSAGLMYNARLEVSRMAASLMRVAAEYHSTIKGPYTIPTDGKLGVKVDGGATQPIAFTSGSRTTDQMVTEINATITGATADNFLGFVRITSDTTGSSSSIQIDTAQADSVHATLGFDGTARGGRDNCQMRDFLYSLNRTTGYR